MKSSTIKQQVLEICQNSKKACFSINNLETITKNKILNRVAQLLEQNTSKIINANKKDLKNAQQNKLSSAKIDRLKLDEERISNIIKAVKDIIKLEDPTAKVIYEANPNNGLNVKRVTTPIGVLMAIYESRPNVTSDIAALGLKSGNVVILRCGSDSINSSTIIAEIYREALKEFAIDQNCVTLVSNTDRQYVTELLKMSEYIDVVIPRGGKSLIKAISQKSKIPLFKHLDGNCHSYVHEKCDITKARDIIINAKMRRAGICGATESLVIDKKIAQEFIPIICDVLLVQNCEIRGDSASRKIDKRIIKARNSDFATEYLDKILSLKIVNDIDEAIAHINQYSSNHTESIITEDSKAATQFLREIDSAIVMHNASTQFADGGEFGLGAEVGIATGRLHARGPVGLEQLTTYKYVVSAKCGIRK